MKTQSMTPEQAQKATLIQTFWESIEALRDVNLLTKQEYAQMNGKLLQMIKRNGLDLSETHDQTTAQALGEN